MDDDARIRKRLKIAVTVAILLVIGIIIMTFMQAKQHRGDSSELVSPDSPASIVYDGDVYLTGNTAVDNMIRQDLAFFARKHFAAYDPSKQPGVVFTITDKPASDGAKTSFRGSYKDVKDTLTVSFTVLKNDRIKTSITDTATNANSDADLPSNSVRNQYIATLPVYSPAFSISYVEKEDAFIVSPYSDTPAARSAALKALQTGLKIDSLESVSYRIVLPASAGSGAPPGL